MAAMTDAEAEPNGRAVSNALDATANAAHEAAHEEAPLPVSRYEGVVWYRRDSTWCAKPTIHGKVDQQLKTAVFTPVCIHASATSPHIHYRNTSFIFGS